MNDNRQPRPDYGMIWEITPKTRWPKCSVVVDSFNDKLYALNVPDAMLFNLDGKDDPETVAFYKQHFGYYPVDVFDTDHPGEGPRQIVRFNVENGVAVYEVGHSARYGDTAEVDAILRALDHAGEPHDVRWCRLKTWDPA